MTISYDEHQELIERHICFECIGESFLSGQVEAAGQDSTCHYCKETQASISMEDLANKVETVFQTHFARTPDEPNALQYAMQNDRESTYEWNRKGQPTGYVIMDAADLREEIAMDVRDILEFRYHDFDSAAAGIECDFAAGAYYEEIMPENGSWHAEWREFERLIKTEARFFSRAAAAHLSKLFDQIDRMCTRDERSLVVDAGPDTGISQLYRARVFQSEAPLLKAMQNPDLELSAPPAWAAGAGRMNARGISVFYGATTPDIALAEVRPPVGSTVAMARFDIIRPLRLLDLTALGNVHEAGSIFDPDYEYRLGRMQFLRMLSKVMAQPVMPDDQETEYLPTQAIADYLATEGQVPLDGILFPSVQAGGNGLNVVLFHKASRTQVRDLPEGIEIRARTHSLYAEGWEADYSVVEEVPPAELGEENGQQQPTPFGLEAEEWNDPREVDSRESTLRIDMDSLNVHEVTAVQIKTQSHPVLRYRFERTDPPF